MTVTKAVREEGLSNDGIIDVGECHKHINYSIVCRMLANLISNTLNYSNLQERRHEKHNHPLQEPLSAVHTAFTNLLANRISAAVRSNQPKEQNARAAIQQIISFVILIT